MRRRDNADGPPPPPPFTTSYWAGRSYLRGSLFAQIGCRSFAALATRRAGQISGAQALLLVVAVFFH